MKILVVDDSLLIRNQMKVIIKSLGHEAISAINGREAIYLYKKEKPYMVTMDLSMPIMDGISALKHIMRIDPYARVVVTTSNGASQLVLESIRDGALDYILKPITIVKLRHVFQKMAIEILNGDPQDCSDDDFEKHLFDDI